MTLPPPLPATADEYLARLDSLLDQSEDKKPAAGKICQALELAGEDCSLTPEEVQQVVSSLRALPPDSRMDLFLRLARASDPKRENHPLASVKSEASRQSQRVAAKLLGEDGLVLASSQGLAGRRRSAALRDHLRAQLSEPRTYEDILPDLLLSLAGREAHDPLLALTCVVAEAMGGTPERGSESQGGPAVDCLYALFRHSMRTAKHKRRPRVLKALSEAAHALNKAVDSQVEREHALRENAAETERQLEDQRQEVRRLRLELAEARTEVSKANERVAQVEEARAGIQAEKDQLARQYDILQQSSEVQRATSVRGVLRGIKGSADYELGDILEELPDGDDELATLIRTRVKNFRRKLDTLLKNHSPDGG